MGHGKPRVVQDKTEEGSPARSESSGNSRTTASAASSFGWETNDHTVPPRRDGQNPAYRRAMGFLFFGEKRAVAVESPCCLFGGFPCLFCDRGQNRGSRI